MQVKLYLVCPGYVRSQRDAQRHYIAAHHLMRLYRVNPALCVVRDSAKPNPKFEDLIRLEPRTRGDYTVPRAERGDTMGNDTFKAFRDSRTPGKSEDNRCLHIDGSWCVFVGFERRGYPIYVQRAKDDKAIMVKAGCRFKTLRQSMAHWGRRRRGAIGKEILQMINIGLKTAERVGFINSRFYPKFFSTKLTRP